MSIRDDELVEFLIGEADATLSAKVERALQSDPSVATRLEVLRAALGLLDSLKSSSQPPEDLVARTMLRIENDAAESTDPSADDLSADDTSASFPMPKQPTVRLRRAEFSQVGVRTGRTPWDSVMLTVSVVALTCLMLPLVLEARSKSRRLHCESNLRQLGHSLTQLAQLDPEHRFPSVPVSGREGFAGIYSVKLQDRGLLDSSSWLRCVSLPGSLSTSQAMLPAMSVPTTQVLNAASDEQLAVWRSELGGDFAYHFGGIDGQRIVGPRLEGRSNLAILADAPMVEGDRDVFLAHEGRGINIYYEDGHVAFFYFPREMLTQTGGNSAGSAVMVKGWPSVDYPFRNMEDRPGYGLNSSDAALGPSDAAPLPARIAIESSDPRIHQ